MNPLLLNKEKEKIAAGFNQAAMHYDAHAVLQKEVNHRLLKNLQFIKLKPHIILDVGCSTGAAMRSLQKQYRGAQIVGVDLAFNMLQLAQKKKGWFSRQHFITADAQALPLKDASVDLIVSNLTLQWCPDLLMTFCELFRVLKPGGALFFSTLGPDTLKELRDSWKTVDDFSHVNTFKDMHDIGDLLLHARFIDPIIDREDLTITYTHVKTLLKDLKYTGAHTILGKQQKTLMAKHKLHAMYQAYESYRNQDGVLPASYEVIYGHAIKPCLTPLKLKPRDTIYIPVGAITRTSAGI